jgi:Flp pilus assembly protein TadG
MPHRPKIRRRNAQSAGVKRGQGLVEFALVVPAFFLILGAVIQFGIWFWDQNTLNQLVRDAGRYAATVQDCTALVGGADITTHVNTLKSQTPFAGTYGTTTVTLPVSGGTGTCPPASNADVQWVQIKLDANVPVFFPLLNGAISSTATYRMEPKAP